MFGCLLFEQMDNLLHIVRILCNILLGFLLFFSSEFGRASTPFMIIESCKMTRFPRIEPMRDRETIDIKNVHKISSCPALKTEENTMSALSDPMMLTLFIASPE
jgi:hypothetical protein